MMNHSEAAAGPQAPGRWRAAGVFAAALLLTACASKPTVPYDYTAFKASRPASLLVLPPVNETPEVNASFSVLAQATLPLAESGYYVLPVSLVNETFKENGLTNPVDMHALEVAKLRSIFGADAGVYITVKQYGTVYAVLASTSTVVVEAKVVDLRDGKQLWQGAASASSAENQNSNQGGLVGMLIGAVVNQIVQTATEASHPIAGIANGRLLGSQRVNGILPGPRAPAMAAAATAKN